MPATVGQLLRESALRLADAGSETPRLDVEVLLGHVLHVDRATLMASPDASVGADAQAEFDGLVARRATGEPIAYIRGIKEFYGLVFSVDPRVLIPRPETETLVDLALARVTEMLTSAPRTVDQPLTVWDVGTGSGAIIVALAVEARRRGYAGDVSLRATDSSPDAPTLALENAVVHGVADRIEFGTADLACDASHSTVDLLLANLPYIPSATIPTLPVAASFEPVSALDGGDDGLRLVRRLVSQLPSALSAHGTALLEIGADQAAEVERAVADLGEDWSSVVHHDLTGRDRVVEIRRAVA